MYQGSNRSGESLKLSHGTFSNTRGHFTPFITEGDFLCIQVPKIMSLNAFKVGTGDRYPNHSKGSTINDLGGQRKYQTRIFFLGEAFLEFFFPGKAFLNFFSQEGLLKFFFPGEGPSKFFFSRFSPAPPRSLMVEP